MDPMRWAEIRLAFDALVELDAAERTRRLAALEAMDPELRRALDLLLAADAEVDEERLAVGPAADPLRLVGRTVSHFRVLESLGAGGMGAVYRAEDTRLRRAVALKFLLPQYTLDPLAKERFLQEARSAAALDHPNVCTVLETGEGEDGSLFLAMPLYPGETLRERLAREGALPVHDAVAIATQVARGLERAHAAGIVHRDLKPGNLMLLPDGTVKILDFGLAKARDLSLTGTGMRMGTVAYMAPEQVRGAAVDGRADLWALGVVLYEMLTGRKPFGGEGELSMVHAILHEEPPSPASLRPEIPERLERVVLGLLRKEPAERHATAEELLDGLHPAGGGASRRTGGRRWRYGLVPAVLAALGAVVYAGVAWYGEAPSGPERPQIRSLAVLPLENLSSDPGQQYLSDGITEALTAELGRTTGVRVISRTSATSFRGSPKLLPEIARELGVDALVEGSVLRDEKGVRVTVQLVHGPTDRHLWAESYQRQIGDLPSLHGEVAQAIIRRIGSSRTPEGAGPEAPPVSPRSRDPEAYEDYLKGRFYYIRYGQEALLRAMRHYEAAVARDSTFAEAYAALAEVCLQAPIQGQLESLELCKASARRAIELDDRLAEGYAALGLAKTGEWDWAGAEAAFQRALRLNPNSVSARQWYTQMLRETMRKEEALRQIRQAESLDPLNLYVKTMVGWVLFDQHRYDEALSQWDEVLEMDPDYGLAIYNQGLVYALQGKPRETIAAARRAAPRMGADGIAVRFLLAVGHALAGERAQARRILAELEAEASNPGLIAVIHLVLGEEENALGWLERGYERRSFWLPNVTSEPWFDPLRDHPRFRELRRKMGIQEH